MPSFLKIDECKRKELTEADVSHLLFCEMKDTKIEQESTIMDIL